MDIVETVEIDLTPEELAALAKVAEKAGEAVQTPEDQGLTDTAEHPDVF